MTALTTDELADFRGDLGIANSVQRVRLTGGPTGGTFTLSYDGATSGAIAYNAAAGTVQAALELVATIGAGNVEVTGNAGGMWTVKFVGEFEGASVGLLTGSGANLTGGSSPAVAVAVDTVFSDTQLQRFYTRAGEDYATAVVFALRALLADAAKLTRYRSGDHEEDLNQVREGVTQLLDKWEQVAGLSGGTLSAGTIDLALDEPEPTDA